MSNIEALSYLYHQTLLQQGLGLNLDKDVKRKTNRELVALFSSLIQNVKQPDYFLEIGAFSANFSRINSKKLPATKFFALEANPYNFQEFQKIVEKDGVEYVHVAVCDYDGSVKMRLMKNWEGAPTERVRGNNSILPRATDVAYEEVEVSCTSVETFLKKIGRHDDESVSLWIDVEGMAHAVLSGIADVTYSNIDFVFVELEDKRFWREQFLSVSVIEALLRKGFVPIARDFEAVNQYNVIFVRQELYLDHGIQNLVIKYFENIKKEP